LHECEYCVECLVRLDKIGLEMTILDTTWEKPVDYVVKKIHQIEGNQILRGERRSRKTIRDY